MCSAPGVSKQHDPYCLLSRSKYTRYRHISARQDSMAGFSTRYKLYPYKYVYTAPEKGVFTYRDHYRDTNRCAYKANGRSLLTAHDCRHPSVKYHQDTHKWEAFVLAHGLNATYESVDEIHILPPQDFENRKPDKLLFHIGNCKRMRGNRDSEFNWPRGLSVSKSGEIVIADTMNHRIQTFNQYGVLTAKIGGYGKEEGEFDEPRGVAVTLMGDIIVADCNNIRIQVFTRAKKFKESFPTNDEPVTVATDVFYNVIVGTIKRTIEIYRQGGKLVNRFRTFPARRTKNGGQINVAVNDLMNTIVISDVTDRMVKEFNYRGDLLRKFEPIGVLDGLACVPGGISVLINGSICIADVLNHTVSLFDENGQFIKQLVGPTDGCGCVQQCAISPEGHLVTTEFSVDNNHCFKVFRYKDCECHRFRPGSSKRPQTPNAYQMGSGADSNADVLIMD